MAGVTVAGTGSVETRPRLFSQVGVDTLLGGRLGSRALRSGVWFTAGPWVMLTATMSWLLLMARQMPCLKTWNNAYTAMCYNDIVPLYYARGLAQGRIPFLDTPVEYPVLTGAFMEVARRFVVLTGGVSSAAATSAQQDRAATVFFGVTAFLLLACFLALVWAHLKMSRPWDAMLIAASPAVLTAGLVNWDMLVLALTSLALLAWSRRNALATGVFIGLGIAAKLYPLLLLVPLAVLCLRSRRLREFAVVVAGTVVAWVAVNLPVYLLNPENWMDFWTSNVRRGADLGSFWYVLHLAGIDVPSLSLLVAVLMVIGTLTIGALLLMAPTRPRLAQGVFLVVVLFLVVNKVYSPQYVLWLLPLLILARPRIADWTLFAISETAYFAACWGHLAGGLATGAGGWERLYGLAVILRIAVQLLLASRVIGDMWHPERDVVRAGGRDDPEGGVLDAAPDADWVSAFAVGARAS